MLAAFASGVTQPTFQGVVSIEVTGQVGEERFVATGSGSFQSAHSHFRFEASTGIEVETLTLRGTRYERSGGSPWIQLPVRGQEWSRTRHPDWLPAGAYRSSSFYPEPALAIRLARANALEAHGTRQVDGTTLHRIGLAQGAEIPPDLIDLLPEASLTVEPIFWSHTDGRLHSVEFILQASAPGEPSSDLTITMTVLEDEERGTILAPDDPWRLHHSQDAGYSIGHPRGWDVIDGQEVTGEGDSSDVFVGLSGESFLVTPLVVDPPGPVSLNIALEAARAELEQLAATQNLSITYGDLTEIEIMGLSGRRYTYTFTEEGQRFNAAHAMVQVSPSMVFQFVAAVPEGNGDATQSLADFLATFRYFVQEVDETAPTA